MTLIASIDSRTFPLLSGYRLTEQIHQGARTSVYRALQLKSQRTVAIKILHSPNIGPEDLAQFRNQYTITKNLTIPGVARPLSLAPWRNSYALVMEDFGGISLQQYAIAHPLSISDILAIALQMADILNDLCQHRIIHKDIKPANIVIDPDSKRIQLIDFSIASVLRRETQDVQHPAELEGTLAYLSPEQTGRMNRGIDYRTDFYGLGVTLYELLTGELPFQSNDPMELVHCHIAQVPMPPHLMKTDGDTALPFVLSKIVLKLMAKNAEDRYQSALGLRHDLARCLSQWKKTGTMMDFELGTQDVSDRFLIPEKLYGRQTEVQALLDAFNRVSQSPLPLAESPTDSSPEILLITGSSGIGKTAVINEVHKPITQRQGYFIEGKFDQFNRSIPLSAFVQALQSLIDQILSESDRRLSHWRDKILAAIGKNGRVLTEVIPNLEQVIGPQPAVPDLSGNAAQSRFNHLFQKFIAVFTTSTHPLVLFLDDLQWADAASLELIALLMLDTRHLLLLGAYRDREVSPAHPFRLTMKTLQAAGTRVSTITLAPLSFYEINQMVAETLHCLPERSQPLSELIFKKTQGNPFFTTQFLKALYENGVISFSQRQGHWECNLAQATDLSLTEDVVTFMAQQLQKLPQPTQQVLKLAACIGNQFDLETLAIVSNQSIVATREALWPALQEGLAIPHREVYKFHPGQELGDDHFTSEQYLSCRLPQQTAETETETTKNSTYRFLHDRVQQAAYSLIPDREKQSTHYSIGQLVLRKLTPAAREDRIFELTNQLNQGMSLIVEQSERDELAQLNLMACRKAKAAIAYQAGQIYARIGLQLLGEQAWQSQYEMTLAFHTLTAELASFCGDTQRLEDSFKAVVDQTHSPLEQIEVYRIKTLSETSQNQLDDAIAVGKEILTRLGITFPETPTPSDIRQAMMEIETLMNNRTIDDLVDLPEMSAPEELAVMNMVAAVTTPAYLSGSLLHPLLTVLAIKLSIQQGNAEPSTLSYACYGLMACTLPKDIDTGIAYGKLTQKLISKLESKVFKPAALLVVGMFLMHRDTHIKASLSILRNAYTASVEVGNVGYTGYTAAIYGFHAFWCGQSLSSLEQEIAAYAHELEKLNQPTTTNWCLIYQQSILNLLEETSEPYVISGDAFVEADFIADLYPSKDLLAIHFFCLNKLMLSYLFGEIESAEAQITEIRQHLDGVLGQIGEAIFYFYDSLTALSVLSALSAETEDSQQEILAHVEQNQTQLKQYWASHAPMNYQHKIDLVEAEKYRVLGHNADAIEYYDRAIAAAKAHDYVQEEALANELAAKFYLDWGKERVAAGYMQEAYYTYLRWGAKTKAKHLERNYPQLLNTLAEPLLETTDLPVHQTPLKERTLTTMRSLQGTHATTQSAWLDLPSVMKATQAISQEIGLEKLLATLMQIAIANAGAQTGHFIRCQKNQWVVVVRADQAQSKALNVQLDGYSDLPHSVVYSVARTRKTAVFENLSTLAQFAGDRYVATRQPKSVLCLPVSRQGELVGILYLENNLTVGAFTCDRIEILQMLASQAAISLENARLYKQAENYSQMLEAEVTLKTQALNQKAQDLEQALEDLKRTQAQLIHTAKMSSVGQMVAGVAHEINNPINFIKGNLMFTQRVIEDLADLISLYAQKHPQPGPDIQALREDIDLDFLLEDVTKVLHSMEVGSDRISQIVLGLRNFSRLDESETKTVDIHSGLESTLLVLGNRLQLDEPHRRIEIVKSYSDLPSVTCAPGQLNQVFLNIINNAIDAIRDRLEETSRPEIHIHTETVANDRIRIAIANNGSPIDPNIQDKIFDPFFTTKPVGQGTGLGLFTSYSIVQQHQGSLEVSSSPDGNTEFSIFLPIEGAPTLVRV